MQMTSYQHGVPSWVDLGTPDVAAAAAFYGALFGWQSDEGPPEVGGYRICMLRGHPVVGLGPQMGPDGPADGPSYWTTYINVDNVHAITARVPSLGGQVVVPPMQVMDAGTMAVLCDPMGAMFSIWQAGDHIGAELVNEPGTLGWN